MLIGLLLISAASTPARLPREERAVVERSGRAARGNAGGVESLGGESGRKSRRATEPEESGGGSSLERELTTKKGRKFGE